MIKQTRFICKDNLDKRLFINDVPNTLTLREYIRLMEDELEMCPEPIGMYGTDDLIEYVEELQSNIDNIIVKRGDKHSK